MAKSIIPVDGEVAAAPPPPRLVTPRLLIPSDMAPTLIYKDNQWEAMRAGGFLGYVVTRAAPESKQVPFMAWEGGRIHLGLWSQVMAFFEWSLKEFKSEAQVRLYYHPVDRRWTAWAYPQTPNGMTTQEINDHPAVAEQRAQFRDPWILMGTIHHHCGMNAFQSSTDHNNEEAQTGLHMTVGKIGTTEYDLHARVVVRGSQFTHAPDPNCLRQWFELPEGAQTLNPRLHQSILDFYLKSPPADDTPFPEAWKTNCIRRAVTIPAYVGGPIHTHNSNNATSWKPVDTNTRGQFQDGEISFMRKVLDYMETEHLTHNELDALLNMTTEANLTLPEKAHVAAITVLATAHGIGDARVDEMFDKWDFEITLKEIDSKSTAVTIK